MFILDLPEAEGARILFSVDSHTVFGIPGKLLGHI